MLFTLVQHSLLCASPTHPDQLTAPHLLTCLDMSLDSKHCEVLDDAFFPLLSQALVECLALDSAC